MSLLSKIHLRRLFAIGLISITLFFGSAWGIHSNNALAEVLKRDNVGISEDNVVVDDAEYESAKISRNRKQAERSKQAEKDLESESVSDKLNLDEIISPGVKDGLN